MIKIVPPKSSRSGAQRALLDLKYRRRVGLIPRSVFDVALRRLRASWPGMDTSDYVSTGGGVSFGLQYPYRYKEEGRDWVVFSTYDGWVWRRFCVDDERGDYAQRRFWAERRAAQFCEEVNRVGAHGMAINVLHDMEP